MIQWRKPKFYHSKSVISILNAICTYQAPCVCQKMKECMILRMKRCLIRRKKFWRKKTKLRIYYWTCCCLTRLINNDWILFVWLTVHYYVGGVTYRSIDFQQVYTPVGNITRHWPVNVYIWSSVLIYAPLKIQNKYCLLGKVMQWNLHYQSVGGSRNVLQLTM